LTELLYEKAKRKKILYHRVLFSSEKGKDSRNGKHIEQESCENGEKSPNYEQR
jgi:hypothetical protein